MRCILSLVTGSLEPRARVCSLSPLRSSQSTLRECLRRLQSGCKVTVAFPLGRGEILIAPGLKPRRRGSQDPVWEMPVSAWLGGLSCLRWSWWNSPPGTCNADRPLGLPGNRRGALLSDLTVCEGLRPSLTVLRGVPQETVSCLTNRQWRYRRGQGRDKGDRQRDLI